MTWRVGFHPDPMGVPWKPSMSGTPWKASLHDVDAVGTHPSIMRRRWDGPLGTSHPSRWRALFGTNAGMIAAVISCAQLVEHGATQTPSTLPLSQWGRLLKRWPDTAWENTRAHFSNQSLQQTAMPVARIQSRQWGRRTRNGQSAEDCRVSSCSLQCRRT